MQKRLKLNQINENEFSKEEMKQLLGGGPSWPFCFTRCNCPNDMAKKSHKKFARKGNPVN